MWPWSPATTVNNDTAATFLMNAKFTLPPMFFASAECGAYWEASVAGALRVFRSPLKLVENC